ncbi:MAG: HEAT repeat domain-containing protein [Bryobacterales bacterium]
MPQQKTGSANDPLAAQVAQAFEQARTGDGSAVSGLQEQGAAVVAHLGPYVHDADPEARVAAVALLKGLGGAEAVPLLAEALADSDQDIRQRAALALHENYPPYELAKVAEVGPALRKSIAAGNHSAAAILLAGWFPGNEMQAALEPLATAGGEKTELRPASPVVDVALAAHVALSLMGVDPSRLQLQQSIQSGSLDELRFLLEAIQHIDAPEVLHPLADRTLSDRRETVSPGPIGAGDRLRLCDEAVNAFGQNFNLKLGFDASERRRFTDAEISQVDKAVDGLMPR